MIAQNIGFWIIALMMIGAALRVVTTNNVVHAALWLVVVLSGAAGQYILLVPKVMSTGVEVLPVYGNNLGVIPRDAIPPCSNP